MRSVSPSSRLTSVRSLRTLRWQPLKKPSLSLLMWYWWIRPVVSAIDSEMMAEISQLHAAINPIETLFVVDAMTGQDAANTAKAFNDALPLTGVVLTKVDGDARGGAALSVRAITGKPIKFLGMGEKTDALDPFHPDRIASRLLGMGDVLSLIEQAEQTIDKEKAEKLTKKLKKGKGFDLEDFRDQLQQMNKMGGMGRPARKNAQHGRHEFIADEWRARCS